MIRRLVGVALAALALHTSAVRADVACAKHGAKPIAAAAGQDQNAAHRHHAPPGKGPAGKPCETPTQAECCEALVSCSIVAACTDSEASDASVFDHGSAFAGAAKIPGSLVIPPDPPPPKA